MCKLDYLIITSLDIQEFCKFFVREPPLHPLTVFFNPISIDTQMIKTNILYISPQQTANQRKHLNQERAKVK